MTFKKGIYLLLSLLILLLGSCMIKKDIKLGFLGCISGKLGDLGVAGRDGAILAVEIINKQGGINGRNIDLMVEDNGLDSDLCITAAQSLIDKGIEGVIGPMTSDMSLASIDLFNSAKIPMVSPTASTPVLSKLDDYFLRVNPSDASEAFELAQYTVNTLKAENIAVIYDTLNESFTKGVYDKYRNSVTHLKSVNINAYTFLSTEDTDFHALTQSVLSHHHDAVLIVASPPFTALICQQLRLTDTEINIMATGWAMTDDFIEQGGKAVDGVIFNHYHNNNSVAPAYRQFVDDFKERFNRTPNFISVLSYNAVMVWAEAYSTKKEHQSVKERMIEIGTYQGLQGDIILDKYGDAFIERHFITIQDGVFVDM